VRVANGAALGAAGARDWEDQDGDGVGSLTWFLPRGDGEKEGVVAVEDPAGNVSERVPWSVFLDETSPDAPALVAVNDPTNDATPVLAWSALPAESVEQYRYELSVDPAFATTVAADWTPRRRGRRRRTLRRCVTTGACGRRTRRRT